MTVPRACASCGTELRETVDLARYTMPSSQRLRTIVNDLYSVERLGYAGWVTDGSDGR